MEGGLHLRVQGHGHDCLSDSVGEGEYEIDRNPSSTGNARGAPLPARRGTAGSGPFGWLRAWPYSPPAQLELTKQLMDR